MNVPTFKGSNISTMAPSRRPLYPTLELVQESKLYALLPGGNLDDRLEASGVLAKDGYFYVIFDNSPHVARLGMDLATPNPANGLLRQRGQGVGFEDLAYHARELKFLVIIESQAFSDGIFKPRIEEYDDDFRYLDSAWVDCPVERDNKGIEGLTYIQRDGQDLLLGLCEGNRCKGGKAGRRPGGGRIQVLRRTFTQWEHVDTLKMPKSVPFEDYAALDIRDDRVVAVVSQMSSALWIGTLQESKWRFADDGRVYLFPRDAKGRTIYGNIEGVSWTGPDQLVFVSDKRKPGEQPKRVQEKDQSIHVFRLPD